MNTATWEIRTGEVVTASRLRRWWLTSFHGYSACGESEEPKVTWLGSVRLVKHWLLSKGVVQGK